MSHIQRQCSSQKGGTRSAWRMIALTALFVAQCRCGKGRVGCSRLIWKTHDRLETLGALMQATPFGSRLKPRTASLSGNFFNRYKAASLQLDEFLSA